MSRTPFFPLDCDFHNHPKFIQLRELAGNDLGYFSCFYTWVRIGSYCVRDKTAGVLTWAQLREICPRDRTRKKHLGLLCKTCLMERLPDGNYAVHNWTLRNYGAEELAKQKASRKEVNHRAYLARKAKERRGAVSGAVSGGARLDESALCAVENELNPPNGAVLSLVRQVLKKESDAPQHKQHGVGLKNLENNQQQPAPAVATMSDYEALAAKLGWAVQLSSLAIKNLNEVKPTLSELSAAAAAVAAHKAPITCRVSFAVGVVRNARKTCLNSGHPKDSDKPRVAAKRVESARRDAPTRNSVETNLTGIRELMAALPIFKEG